MRRFWTQVSLAEDHAILLDGKPMRLPGGTILRVDPPDLAAAIVAEWQAAGGSPGGDMSWADVPLTTLAGTAQERIAPDPEPTIAALAAYGQTDLLCYRAADIPALAARQAEEWQPWLDWAALQLDAPLLVTQGIVHIPQPADSLAALARAVARLDPHGLAALGVAVPSMGSLVLGLAMQAGTLDPLDAHRIATLDERHQAEFWGTDADAAARMEKVEAEIVLAGRYLRLAKGEGEGLLF